MRLAPPRQPQSEVVPADARREGLPAPLPSISLAIATVFADPGCARYLPRRPRPDLDWLHGGCWMAGAALQRWLGGEALYAAFEPGATFDVAAHVLVRVGPYFLDAGGIQLGGPALHEAGNRSQPADQSLAVDQLQRAGYFLGPVNGAVLREDTVPPPTPAAVRGLIGRLRTGVGDGAAALDSLRRLAPLRSVPDRLILMPDRLRGALDDGLRVIWPGSRRIG